MYRALFIACAIVLLAPFVVVPSVSAYICLDATVLNPVPPPTNAMDYILWQKARENICDWPTGFIPAVVIFVILYGIYYWLFKREEIEAT